jgi:hypothetical protein
MSLNKPCPRAWSEAPSTPWGPIVREPKAVVSPSRRHRDAGELTQLARL